MLKFRHQFEYAEKERVLANAGTPEKVQLKLEFDKTGAMSLKECGKVNMYDEIQSHAESVDIHVLLKRYAAGDVNALNKLEGQFCDVTNAPRSFAEYLQAFADAESTFAQLPAEVRANFDNDILKFVASLDNPADFSKKLQVTKETIEKRDELNDAKIEKTEQIVIS